MATDGPSPDVVVIGAGAVGASTAYELARRGASVEVLDAGAGPGNGCSYANAGLIAPSHVEPLATPANVTSGLRYMLRRDSPFYVSPKPHLAPFLARFAASARPRRVRLLTERMRELAIRSLAMHEQYAKEGLTTSFHRSGLMDVFLTESRFTGAVEALARNRDALPHEVLSAERAREIEPLLGDIAGGLLRPNEAHCDSLEFVGSLLHAAEACGATLRWNTTVRQLHSQDGRIVAAETDSGRVAAGSFVIAAGVASEQLCHSVGLKLPMHGGKGYVVDVDTEGPSPRIPLSVREPRVVATPYPDRLRMCGTLELSDSGNRISDRRVQAIRDGIARTLPGLRVGRTQQTWAGQRPCTADGVPAIGASRAHRNLVLAAGHAMWGLTLGPVTGEMVAQGLLEEAPTLHEAAFSPDRFGDMGVTPTQVKHAGPAATAPPERAEVAT